MDDPYDLNRFVEAQGPVFAQAVEELTDGRKASHWMWFIFPQLRGLGRSAMAIRYGIGSLDEARAYLAHPLLGPRLEECVELTSHIQGRSINAIFGTPDDLKFHSCMTLFDRVAPQTTFQAALQEYFGGRPDLRTLALLDGADAADA